MYGSSNFGDLLTKFETRMELSDDKPFDEELAHMMKGSLIIYLSILNINGNFTRDNVKLFSKALYPFSGG